MYGLAKVANEIPPGYSREDVLRQQVDDSFDRFTQLENSIPEDVQRDQRSAERNRTLAGLGIGGGAGAGLGALGAGKGARGPGALVGGLAGGLAGSLGGGILGAMKSNQILSEREPELYGQINDAYDEYDLAEERLDKHMTHSNPNLDIQRELLELKKQQLAQQQQQQQGM